jgi:putative component of membrane protein insertase Oxa1/YidC/SpoIIIJ protein YidD
MAHYELGRAYWTENNDKEAFIHLKKAFFADSTVEIYRISGCSLYLLLNENPDIDADDSGLRTILATARKEWNRELFEECRKPTKSKPSAAAAPARMLIRFYQTQIGPAIGSRCSLHPSCSHYAMQALKTHGLIGIGIMSDRFIREPDVVAAQKKPVKINGHIKYSDPLSDHDQWMKK